MRIAAGLYGLDNFYYRRLNGKTFKQLLSLYGLDNFYYRRFRATPLFLPPVYTDLIISTIVDARY